MKILIPVEVEMTDEQVRAYAAEYGIATRAKDVVADVRSLVLTAVPGRAVFSDGGADVNLKGR